MPPVLHSRGPADPQALKAVVAAAAASNASIEHRRCSTSTARQPSASSPTSSNVRLELDSGVVLTQPNAISRFLGERGCFVPERIDKKIVKEEQKLAEKSRWD